MLNARVAKPYRDDAGVHAKTRKDRPSQDLIPDSGARDEDNAG